MHEPMKGIKLLLKEDGVFVFEVHYLVDLLEQFQRQFQEVGELKDLIKEFEIL